MIGREKEREREDNSAFKRGICGVHQYYSKVITQIHTYRQTDNMGRLLGLELHNFKSYKGTVKVGFGDSSFTSVIGPNGSGKSNLMDSISFVLGIRSSSLRSSAMADLIYRGSKSDNGNGNSNGNGNGTATTPSFAYVKAFYQKNNTDETPQIVELMRTVSPDGTTTYHLNKEQVTYKEYSLFLESENILIKTKNFLVFQGDVEHIASQSPTDLTRLFEQISGSLKYKREYDSLKEQIEQLSRATAESIKNRRRIHQELTSYEDGINRDEEYKETVSKKVKLEMYYALWQLYHLEKQQKTLHGNLGDLKSNISSLKSKIGAEEKNLQRSRTSFQRDGASVLKMRSTLEYKVKDKERLLLELNLIKLPRRALIKKIANIEKRIEVFKKDMARQRGYVERFERQLEVVRDTRDKVQREIELTAQSLSKYKLDDDAKRLYERLMENYLVAGGGSALEDKLAILNNDRQEIVDELESFERKVQLSRERIDDEINVKLEQQKLEESELISLLNEKNQTHQESINELRQLQAEMESTSNREYDLSHKLRETLVKLDDLSANQRETQTERRLRETVATLRRFYPGVKGLVHDLCHPKKEKYALAVATILGRNFNSIIVDDLSTAQSCIEYMKKQRLGTASFIPLDTVESEAAILPISDSKGCILAINAVDYEPEYERAIQYVCSDSIICDSLEIAKRLKWEDGVNAKLVTLQGALIHRAGLMTGGLSNETRNSWSKEEYQSLMSLKDRLLEDIEAASAAHNTASIKARELETSISLLNTEIANTRTQLSQVSRAVEESKVELNYQNNLIKNEYGPKITTLKQRRDEFDEKIKEVEEQRQELQDVMFEEFTKKLGFTVREYESHSGERMRQQSKEVQQLQRELLNVENKLQFETTKLSSNSGRLTRAERDLEEANSELLELEKKEKTLQGRVKDIEQDIVEREEEIKELQDVYDAKQKDLNVTEEHLTDWQGSVDSAKHQREEIRNDIEKLDLERVSVLQNCKLSNIDIPVLSEVSLADMPIAKIDAETIKVSNEIEIDYDKLPQRYMENESTRVKQELLGAIREAEERLSVLQPNARAAERYKETKEKLSVVSKETDKLKAEERKVFSEFIKIKKKRKELFERTFNHVSEHLGAIYGELTRNPNSSAELAGGHASLTLEDEDEPFNAGIRYNATPPLKRFKDMEYLSGGERTVAALALIFAINSFQPSPFFILDEIDAALDVTNVERVATYISRHGNPDLQFIVISLKSGMFGKSDALVGVYKQPEENSSNIVTLDLRKYSNV